MLALEWNTAWKQNFKVKVGCNKELYGNIEVVVVQLLSHVQFFATLWTVAQQAFLYFTISLSLLKLMSSESVMASNHFILYCPFLLLPSIFPIIRNQFPMNQFFALCSQSIGASVSASVLPMNIQGCFPLGSNWLIWSTCSPGVFSITTQFKSINSLALSLLYGPTLISVHDYWENHSFNFKDSCQQSD